jgi:hypothetical protein
MKSKETRQISLQTLKVLMFNATFNNISVVISCGTQFIGANNLGLNNLLILKSVIESGYLMLKYEGHNGKFITSRMNALESHSDF